MNISIQYRINQSLTLLAHPQNNITEVALQVGFNSVSPYIQAFKNIFILPLNNIKRNYSNNSSLFFI